MHFHGKLADVVKELWILLQHIFATEYSHPSQSIFSTSTQLWFCHLCQQEPQPLSALSAKQSILMELVTNEALSLCLQMHADSCPNMSCADPQVEQTQFHANNRWGLLIKAVEVY